MKSLGVESVFGISTQDSAYQAEIHKRVHLQYDLLSDEKLELQSSLKLPIFNWEGKKLIRRLSMAIEGGKVIRWWYPVFPPDKGVEDVIAWLRGRTE